MEVERLRAVTSDHPFPIYEELVEHLVTAAPARDATVAHVLATCSGYAAGDLQTVAMMMSRLGLVESACVRINQVVDAMLIFSTAYLVQSACGRVVILSFRGTEPANIGNWLGDFDVEADSIESDTGRLHVHGGFYRNLRATRLPVLDELACALAGRSLVDHAVRVDCPLEVLYVTGHSLGGAMAVLFALGVAADARQHAIARRLRAVYTYGQPMVATEPLPEIAGVVGRVLYRHVMPRDPVPSLPPVGWGPFVHFGNEYAYVDGGWCPSKIPVAQVEHVRDLSGLILGVVSDPKRRARKRFESRAHISTRYIEALRPQGFVSEFGD